MVVKTKGPRNWTVVAAVTIQLIVDGGRELFALKAQIRGDSFRVSRDRGPWTGHDKIWVGIAVCGSVLDHE